MDPESQQAQAVGTPPPPPSGTAVPVSASTPPPPPSGTAVPISSTSVPNVSTPTGDNRSWVQKAAEKLGSVGNDLMTGAAAGATQHIGNAEATIAQGIHDYVPGGGSLVPQEGINALQSKAQQEGQTTGTAQAIGKGAESAGEFLAPGAGEEKLIGQAGLMGKALYGAATNAAVNKAQGGSATTGAVLGAGGAGLESMAQKLAPKLAEAALGVTQKMRGNGRDIGQAILEHTVGVNPGEISQQARGAIGALTTRLENLAASSPTPASTVPALDVVHNAFTKAVQENSAQMAGKLEQVWDQLTKEFGSGKAIPSQLPASRILDLKRGIGDLVTSWGPEEKKALQPILTKTYGALDAELDRTVPGAQQINQTISSLIPAKQAAAKTANAAPVLQQIVQKGRAATGALVGGGLGAGEGYREAGIPGAVAGGLAGTILPSLVTSPQATMAAARLASKPAVAARIPVAAGSMIANALTEKKGK